MTGYNVQTSNDESTKTISTTNVSETAISDYAKKGNGYARITNLNSVEIDNEDLIAYYDYKDYTENSTKWNNKLSSNYDINFEGTPTIDTDGGVRIDRKTSNVYGTIDLSDKKDKDLTIYMVVKSNVGNSNNPRIFEIPKNPTGNQYYTTPVAFTNGSNNIGYGAFARDSATTVPAMNYNVIAMRLDNTNGNDNGGGTLSFFVNDTKCETVLNYEGRGDKLYLSHSTVNNTGYGDNVFGMIAIYDEAQTDSEILSNLAILSNQYID